MRVKTSVSLSNEVLSEVSHFTADGERSEFIEKAIWTYLAVLHRQARNQADLNKINAASEFLNNEAQDTLSYQVPL